MWCIDPFLGNSRETGVTRQQILSKQQLNCNKRGTIGNDVFYAVRAKGLYNEDTSRVSCWRKKRDPCGGGVEYLDRNPASRRRRRRGNPVIGGTTGPPCSWGIKIRGLGPTGWGSRI
jgi:hypothetical protein